MNERHNTKIAVFGGKPGENVEFKGLYAFAPSGQYSITYTENESSSVRLSQGMAGNQVLEWTDLDTEIKSAKLKNVRLSYMFTSL